MAIISKPKATPATIAMPAMPAVTDAQARAFMEGAPDAGSLPSAGAASPRKSQRSQISHTMPADLLRALDTRAAKLGLSRAAFINVAVSRALAVGLTLDAGGAE